MVPNPPASVARQRYEALAKQNGIGSSALFAPISKPPQITYGKSKRLPLNGGQFIRPDIFALPSDDEEDEDDPAQALVRAAHRSDDDDSDQTPSRLSKLDIRNAAAASRPKSSSAANKKGRAKAPRKPKIQPRRLPVAELVCVPSLSEDAIIAQPASSGYGVESQDPIDGASTQLTETHLDATISISALKDRLKTPKFRRVKRKPVTASYHKSGDGFEPSELQLTRRAPPPKQRRRRKDPVAEFAPLQLESGPLPDVCFECPADELQLEPSGGPHHLSSSSKRELQREESAAPDRPVKRRRAVSFSDVDQMILDELSSVSAPPVRYVDSDSEDDDEEDEEELDEDADEDDENEAAEDEETSTHGDEPVKNASHFDSASNSAMRSSQKLQTASPYVEDVEDEDEAEDAESNDAFTVDFRSARPGALPRSLGTGRQLVEVRDAIEDAEVTTPNVQMPLAATQAVAPRTNEDIDTPAGTQSRPRRLRSILKNSSGVPDSTILLHELDANTRRNSMIVADESGYFATAAGMPDVPDPSTHRIIPRRRSSYFDDGATVQVADSDRAVLETSPGSPPGQLSVLKSTAEATWTSSAGTGFERAPVKSLKMLTRAVSREHGTISQSARRRSSLSFSLPTKMR